MYSGGGTVVSCVISTILYDDGQGVMMSITVGIDGRGMLVEWGDANRDNFDQFAF